MMTRIARSTSTAALALLTLTLVTRPGLATDFLPGDEGLTWEYAGTQDGVWTLAVDGDQIVIGEPTIAYRFEYDPAGDAHDWFGHYFFTRGPAGAVLFHGAHEDGGLAWSFDPPLVWMPGDPVPGETTTTVSEQYYNLEGTGPSLTVVYAVTVVAQVDLSVPAGDFSTWEVLAGNGDPFRLAGAPATGPLPGTAPGARDPQVSLWFGDGVGIVQLREAVNQEVYSLVEWSGPVATEATTWSALKAVFDPR